ncbi:MAG: threonine/serine exporter family protein [Oscillospiraceae bacterium]|nr:threonine/serine exporter family protein [Oscillospiraceae bacterium]
MEPTQLHAWDPQDIMTAALSLGERILISGGEVSRVEDTIGRVLRAYGARRVDALTITSSIVVTAAAPGWGTLTQTRRITGHKLDLEALRALNELSRQVCAEPIPPEEFQRRLEAISRLPRYSQPAAMAGWALTAGSFAVFFGGNLIDALWAAGVGALLKVLDTLFARLQLNSYFAVILSSLCGGALAGLAPMLGLDAHPSFISIGSIMLLIPGFALTNAIRDLFSGETISGLLRCSESVVLSLAIAWGFAYTAAGTTVHSDIPVPVYLLTALLGCLGFGMVFNLRGQNLALAAGCGTFAWGVVLALQGSLGELTAFFCASVAVTLLCEVLARLRRCPVTVFLVVGIIAMVPGGSLYRTMRYAIGGAWDFFASQGVYTLLYAVSIAAGILCVTAPADVYKRLRR